MWAEWDFYPNKIMTLLIRLFLHKSFYIICSLILHSAHASLDPYVLIVVVNEGRVVPTSMECYGLCDPHTSEWMSSRRQILMFQAFVN